MPPRRGLFGRFTNALGQIADRAADALENLADTLEELTEREPEPERPEPVPGPPPRRPPRRPPSPPLKREDQFREVWNDNASDRIVAEIHDRTGRSETEIFEDLLRPLYVMVTEEERAVQLEMWRDYIDAFVNDDPTYTKNDFFAEWDIARSSFDWQAWREARGYRRRK